MLPLSDLEQSTGVGKRVIHTSFISKHAFNGRINSPSEEAPYFSRLKKYQPSAGKKGGMILLQLGKRGALWVPQLFKPKPTTQ